MFNGLYVPQCASGFANTTGEELCWHLGYSGMLQSTVVPYPSVTAKNVEEYYTVAEMVPEPLCDCVHICCG